MVKRARIPQLDAAEIKAGKRNEKLERVRVDRV